MPLQTLIGPAARPIDVIEARNHVRQDLTADDTVLDMAIRATTSFAQAECLRTLVATRYRLVLDSFPGPSLMGMPWGRSYSLPGHAICLEYGPVLAVKWIKYLDMAGVQQTMPATDYAVDFTGPVARITPVFGKIWPIPLPQIGAVEVVYDAGDAAAITADAAANAITIKGGLWKTLAVGDTVRLSNSGGALPAPLQSDTDYFVQSVPAAGVCTLAITSGGAAIDLTDAGSGTSFIGAVPEGIKTWQKMRLASLYDLRSDVTALARGRLESVPFVDRLLDPWRLVLA
jgi:uncharacterized phiE125 gp8 family phage protein